MKIKTVFVLLCAIIVVVAVFWLNATWLVEAFGAGPPYYGRTTNMDKWTNPIPILVIIDISAVLILIALLVLGFSKNKYK